MTTRIGVWRDLPYISALFGLVVYKVVPYDPYKWSYNPYRWPFKWASAAITPINGDITVLIASVLSKATNSVCIEVAIIHENIPCHGIPHESYGQIWIRPWKLTWQSKTTHLKMHLLLNMVIVHSKMLVFRGVVAFIPYSITQIPVNSLQPRLISYGNCKSLHHALCVWCDHQPQYIAGIDMATIYYHWFLQIYSHPMDPMEINTMFFNS